MFEAATEFCEHHFSFSSLRLNPLVAEVEHGTPPQNRLLPPARWILCCLGLTGIVMLAAAFELQRVEDGRLFALSLPWDADPTFMEIQDAKNSAAEYRIPTVLFLALVGVVVTLNGPKRLAKTIQPSRAWRFLTALFLLSVLADLATTLWFFHDGGIDLELHPGIRLFGYAYGRTIGPLLGKTVQAIGVLGVAHIIGRGGIVLLSTITCLYALAAVYNISQM
jgi:hypothetical protein